MSNAETIPLVYILSNGRSGTTLLDLLLGAQPQAWTTGEVQLLPWELLDSDCLCGCGHPLGEDPFWSEVLEITPMERSGYHIGYFRNQERVGKVLRWSLLPDLIRGRVTQRWRDAAREYGRRNGQLLQSVQEVAMKRTDGSIRWLVDASKDPYRLLWLQEVDQFDVKVIHLVKDPRSFVYSMVRPQLPNAPKKTLRMTGRWIIENALMSRLCRTAFRAEDVRHLAYEDLASAPVDVIASLTEWLGLDFSEKRVHNFKDYENHAVSGNAMRWRETDDHIRLDERWKRNLPEKKSRFIEGMTALFLEYCGYRDTLW